jgi:tetratricopeptide (TPR) repeat protein
MKKSFCLSFVLLLTVEICFAQYQSTFVPMDLNLIQRSLENRQRQYDNNLAYMTSLKNWAQDLRGKQTDKEFEKAMDFYIARLDQVYVDCMGDLSAASTPLANIENGINAEINNYNKRVEKLNDPNLYWQKGIEYYNNKDFSNAITEFKMVQSLAPDFMEVYSVLGYSYFALGDLNSSLTNFNKSIENKPTKDLYERRGWVKYYLGDSYGALSDFNQQVALDPGNANAYYNRGSAKSEMKDYYGAINDYKKAIELNPSFSMAYNNLGWAKFEQKDYAGALKYLNISIDKDPENYVAWDSRGETKFNLGDLKGCISDCSQAISLNDKLANSYLIRGRAKYKLGKKDEACIDWSEAGQYGKTEAYEFIQKYCK